MHYKTYKSILSPQNGMNLYRGCSHGCIYCDSRSRCYQMDHAFEDIEIKEHAAEILEKQLSKKKSKCMISTGSMCDPYIPLERQLRVTRSALEVINRMNFGVTVLTKSASILDDLELYKQIHKNARCVIQMTLTTHDESLCKIIEPNVSTTKQRVEALKVFADNGIPSVVWLDPFLPFINDTEENLIALLNDCIEANVKGIIFFAVGLTLREGNREYFYLQLDRHFPGLKDKYRNTYGLRYQIESPDNKRLSAMFHSICEANGILHHPNDVFAFLREFPQHNNFQQLTLF